MSFSLLSSGAFMLNWKLLKSKMYSVFSKNYYFIVMPTDSNLSVKSYTIMHLSKSCMTCNHKHIAYICDFFMHGDQCNNSNRFRQLHKILEICTCSKYFSFQYIYYIHLRTTFSKNLFKKNTDHIKNYFMEKSPQAVYWCKSLKLNRTVPWWWEE